MNIKRNLYLTATDGRSSKDENAIFGHVFTKAIKFTKNAKHKRKWIEYCCIHVNTHVPFNVAKYQLENGRGMNATKYGKAVIKRDRRHVHFNAINELLRMIFTRDEHAKVLIFMPLIELCEDLRFFINTHLNKDQSFDYDLRIGTINSHNSKAENEHTGRCDVIISTILSCGTGKDIPGLTDIICCSPFKSKITTEQVFGRLRYYGKTCGYYDIIDDSVKMDVIFAKLRSKTIKTLALSMSELQFDIF
jgi:superfamily II DNA or RNA helicase